MIEFDETKTPEEHWDYIKHKMFKEVPLGIDNLVKNFMKNAKSNSEKLTGLVGVMVMTRLKVTGESPEEFIGKIRKVNKHEQ